MMNINIDEKIPDEVLELLPWYTTGNLSEEDHAYFDKALSVYPLLKELLKEETQILEKVLEDKSLIEKSVIASQEERLKSVFNIINTIETEEKVVEPKTNSVLETINSYLGSLIPNNMSQYMPIAGVGILVVSVAVLTAFVTPIFTENDGFIPAGVENKPEISTKTNSEILVGFNGTPKELSENATIKDEVFKVEAIADKKGFYKVIFKKKYNISEVKGMIDSLNSQEELIWFAGESF